MHSFFVDRPVVLISPSPRVTVLSPALLGFSASFARFFHSFIAVGVHENTPVKSFLSTLSTGPTITTTIYKYTNNLIKGCV